ncbi:MAG: fasciclin domain-containing protein [Bacteroidaceae bacterium]|nr:fasciclin domain-containing protein [Bacteroidaceae bacterium]
MKILSNIKNYCSAALIVGACAAVTLNSCTENIDESDLYTFTGEMMVDHFENNPDQFSSYLTILGKVHPSKRSSSTMRELLDARGHYTCFAPTNKAIALYLDSLLHMEEPQVSSTNVDEIPDSIAQAIVFNSIIENGDLEAFATTDFEEGALGLTNMNDRYVSISYGTRVANVSEQGDTALATVIYVNTNSAIVEADIEVENGYIHAVDKVLSPSNASISDLIMTTPNTQFFGELLHLTGWDKKMTMYKDQAWEDKYDDIRGEGCGKGSFSAVYPKNRYVGFTIFVETDSIYESKDLKEIEKLKTWVRENNYYDDDTSGGHPTLWDDNYENEDNWLNQFVAYHCLPERLTYNTMVVFANEYGCDASMMKSRTASQFYVNVWEYWETLGKQRRLMKITGCREKGIIQRRINRKSVYNQSTYREAASLMYDPGIYVNSTNKEYDNQALNGFYFTIDDILIWKKEVPTNILNERMRFDITSLFPEFMTNNIRQTRTQNWICNLDYLDNLVSMTDETLFQYLPNRNYESGMGAWMDYQADEFNIQGQYDFTMKLPPVPYTGTYELRYGVWANNNRGMAQIYMGKNPANLPAIGIPIDLRSASGTNPASTGWVAESTIAPAGSDSTAIYENMKTMRNLGFMKGAKYIQVVGGTGRDSQDNLRKIIYTGQFEAGQTYYIRFKSVLTSSSTEFFYDYLEFVPKSVYAGEFNEDIW